MRATQKRWTNNLEPITSGSGSSSFTSSTVQALTVTVAPSPRAGTYWIDDFIEALSSLLVVTGAGAIATSAADVGHIGTITQTMSVAGTDGHRIIGGQTAVASVLLGGGAVHYESCGKIPVLSDATNNIVVRVGLADCATALLDAVDGAYFEYDFATHGDHKWRMCCASNSVRTKVDTGILAVADTYQRFEIDINAGATSVAGAIGGVQCAAVITTNIPTAVARNTTVMLSSHKQLGAGALTTKWDYHSVAQTYTTARG